MKNLFSNIWKKRWLAFAMGAIILLSQVMQIGQPAFGTLEEGAAFVHSPSDAESILLSEEEPELENLEVEFTGLTEATVFPGETIDLLEGVRAVLADTGTELTVEAIEVRDSSARRIPLDAEGRFVMPEEGSETYTVRYGALAAEETLEELGILEPAEKSSGMEAVSTPSDGASSSGETNVMLFRAGSAPASSGDVLVGSAFRRLRRGLSSAGTLITTHRVVTAGGTYSTEFQQGEITYRGSTVNGTVNGAYIELLAPIRHLDETPGTDPDEIAGLRVAVDPGKVESVEYSRRMIGGEEYIVAKLGLPSIISTTFAQFNYNVKFKEDRLTPADYLLPVDAKFYITGETGVWSDPGDVDYQNKYDPQVISKFAGTNTLSTQKQDNVTIYGGASTGGIITDPIDVPFMFAMQTKENSSPYATAPAIYRQRLIERMEIEDELPLYRDERTGQMVRASFNPANNPGWTLSPDGTKVRYTAQSTSDDTIYGGADAAIRNLVLNLQFPGLKVNSEGTSVRNSIGINNRVTTKLYPYGGSAGELTNPETVSDNLIFKISMEEFNPNGMIDKYVVLDKQRIPLDYGSMHQAFVDYRLRAVNGTSWPLNDFYVRDNRADEKLYYKAVKIRGWSGSHSARYLKEIWGLDSLGNRTVKLYPPSGQSHVLPPNGAQWLRIPLDAAAEAEVEGYAAQVEAGTMAANDVPAASRRIQGFDMVYDPAYPLQPGSNVYMEIELGFLDPYHLQVDNDELENYASLHGTYTNSLGIVRDLRGIFDSASAKLVPMEEKIYFSKTSLAPTGTLGENVKHTITLNFNDISRGRWFRNPKIVEVLPKGLEYTSMSMAYNPLGIGAPGIINDYQGTGRQALIFNIPDFKPGLFNDSTLPSNGRYIEFDIFTRITQDAMPDPTGVEDTSKNRAFFTSDNFYPMPSTMTPITGSTAPGMVPDIYDVDGNPATSQVLGAVSNIRVNIARSIRSYKEIRPQGGGWSRGHILTRYGENFDYSMLVENAGAGNINFLTIYDILPYQGDHPYTGHTGSARNSDFRNTLRGAVIAPPGFTVYYSTNPSPGLSPIGAVADPAMAWSNVLPGDPAQVTAIKIEIQPGHSVSNNQILRFVVPMKAAEKPANGIYTTERAVNNYAVSYDNSTNFGVSNSVSNSFFNTIPVEKVWSGGSGYPAVEVLLKRNGSPYTSPAHPDGKITIDAASGWKGEFADILFHDAGGTPYTFTIEEVGAGSGALRAYTPSVTGTARDGFTLTNTYVTKAVPFQKIWSDDSNASGHRPASIEVQLIQNTSSGTGTNYGTPVTISGSGNTWNHTFQNLPAYDGTGAEYTYTAKEMGTGTGALKNYTSQVQVDAGTGAISLTNTLQTVSVGVEKRWVGDTGSPGYRPASVNIQLKRSVGTGAAVNVGTPHALSGTGDSWNHTFTGLPRYDASGAEYTYTVEETGLGTGALRAYRPSVSGTAQNGYIVTNTFQTKSVPFEKIWMDNNNALALRPPSVQVQLVRATAPGTEANVGGPVTVTGSGNTWNHTFTDLPMYDMTGAEYKYSAVEVGTGTGALRNYISVPQMDPATGAITITNTLQTIEVPVEKRWVGDAGRLEYRPNSVSIQLKRSTGGAASNVGSALLLSGSGDSWQHTYSGLPKYDINGTEYTYSVVENGIGTGALKAYSGQVTGTAQAGFVITNTFVTKSVDFKKVWSDNSDALGLRPSSVQVQLIRATTPGTEVNAGSPVTVNGSGDTWNYTFTNLPVYDTAGAEYKYTATELGTGTGALRNYGSQSRVDAATGEITITNTLRTISVPVQKVWAGDAARLEYRPASVSVQLKRSIGTDPAVNVGSAYALSGSGNTWEHTFMGLPGYDAAGNEYAYSVEELGVGTGALKAYRSDITGYTITNTFITRSVDFKKVWSDNGNALALRPASVRVQLVQVSHAGTEANFGSPVTVSGTGSTWSHTFSDLPVYDRAGNEYSYKATELGSGTGALRNYRSQFQVDAVTGAITITNTLQTVHVPVEKVWVGDGGRLEYRPSSVEIQLKRSTGGTPVNVGSAYSLSGSGDTWQHTFTGLPGYDAFGNEYTYSVEELGVGTGALRAYRSGITGSQAAGYTITNTFITKSVPFRKIWSDDNNVSGLRPGTIEVQLVRAAASGTGADYGSPVALTGTGNVWNHTFQNLPAFDTAGVEYTYTAREVGAGTGALRNYGSQTRVDGGTGAITITNTLQTLNIPVEKVWVGDAGRLEYRPASVNVQLKRSTGTSPAVSVGPPQSLSGSGNTWQHTFTGLPRYDASGSEYVYSVEENALGTGALRAYSGTVTVNGAGGFTITNRFQTKTASFQKIWADNGDALGLRPSSVQIQLIRATAPGTEANVGSPVTLTGAGDTWTHSFTDLPAYDTAGAEYTYTAREVGAGTGALRNYSSTGQSDGSGGISITNTLQTVNVAVEKRWRGDAGRLEYRPSFIGIQLKRSTGGGAAHNVGGMYSLSGTGDNWRHVFTGLPLYDGSGNEYTYSVSEIGIGTGALRSYRPSVAGNLQDGFIITNTFITKSIPVQKIWDDSGDALGLRPGFVQVQLIRSTTPGTETNVGSPVTVNGSGNIWTYTFAGLAAYDTAGAEYSYTAREVGAGSGALSNYSSAVDVDPGTGAVAITNRLDSLSINVEKVWAGDTGLPGYRPASVEIQLKRSVGGGIPANVGGAYTLTGTGNTWQHTFTGLPRYDNAGNEYTYSVDENGIGTGALRGYRKAVAGSAAAGFTITNTVVKKSVDFRKVWDDNNDALHLRPASIQVQLLRAAASGTETAFGTPVTVTGSGNTWTHTFSDLPVYDAAGAEYTYRARELGAGSGPLRNYSSAVDADPLTGAITVTNTLETIRIPVEKRWEGDAGRSEYRPASISIQLKRTAGGTTANVGGVYALSGTGDSWQHTFTGLPRYDASGTEYVYSVEENGIGTGALRAYLGGVTGTASTGFTLTNTFRTKSVPFEKIWADNSNALHLRPASVEIQLIRFTTPGTEEDFGSPVTLTGTGNTWNYTFQNLPAYDRAGAEYSYTARERGAGTGALRNYTSQVRVDGSGAIAITNTLAAITIPVSKVWTGDAGMAGYRPASVNIQLKRSTGGGVPVDVGSPQAVSGTGDTWQYSFTDLPKYDASGNEYTYSVEETGLGTGALRSYTAGVTGTAATGFTVTNSFVKKSVAFEKVWVDNGNAQGVRPASVQIQLVRSTAAGTEANVGSPVTVSGAGNTWSHTFTDLPMYDTAGTAYNYTALELGAGTGALKNYTPRVDVDPASGAITITNTLETIQIPVEKLWRGDAGRSEYRPASVSIRLMRSTQGGTPVSVGAPYALTGSGDSWQHTFTGLPKHDTSGNEYTYSVQEMGIGSGALSAYEADVTGTAATGFRITNTFVTKSLPFAKIWSDNGNALNLRPAFIEVQLVRATTPGTEADVGTPVTLTGTGSTWNHIFQNLPAFDTAGAEYRYTAREVGIGTGALRNYTSLSQVDGATGAISVTNTLQTVSVPVEKRWAGDGGSSEFRPASVSIQLKRSAGAGVENVGAAYSLTGSGNTWQHTFTGLPGYDASGNAYTYSIEEVGAGSGNLANYTTGYGLDGTTLVVENTFRSMAKTVKKSWIGDGGHASMRPATIQVKLKRAVGTAPAVDVAGSLVTMSPSGGVWSHTYTGLPEFAPNGQAYVYSVEEIVNASLINYLVSYGLGAGGELEVINTFSAGAIRARVDWVDGHNVHGVRPSSVQIQLQRSVDGVTFTDVDGPVTVHAVGNYEHVFSGYPEYDSSGTRFIYRIAEIDQGGLRNYPSRVFSVDNQVLVITNTIQTISHLARKIWDDASDAYGVRPGQIEFTISRSNGTHPPQDVQTLPVTGSGNTWNVRFDNLVQYDEAGLAYDYAVREETDSGLRNYAAPVYAMDSGVFTVTNSIIPNGITLRKVWEDASDARGIRPARVKVFLYRTSGALAPEHVGTAEFGGAGDTWTHTFTNMAVYDRNGQPYTYSAVEETGADLRNYTVSYAQDSANALRVTNRLDTIQLEGKKIWREEGRGFSRPAALVINLYRSDNPSVPLRQETVSAADADPSNADQWLYRFGDLLQYDTAGVPYTYRVEEDVVPDFYTAIVTGYDITNTYPQDTRIPVRKVWNDTGNLPANLPASTTFHLLRDGVVFDSVTLSRANAASHNWEHVFHVGESQARGRSFSVIEDPVSGYIQTSAMEGDGTMVFTNTYQPVPVTIDVPLRKTASGAHLPSGEVYRFTMTGENGAPLPAGSVGGVAAIDMTQGSHTFGQITFSYPGVYTYSIREVDMGADGFTYDSAVYTVQVTVTDTAGVLSAAVNLSREREGSVSAAGDILFENTYVRPTGDLLISKAVINEYAEQNISFSFILHLGTSEQFSFSGTRQGGAIGDGTLIVLEDGEFIRIHGIPTGTVYTIEEQSSRYFQAMDSVLTGVIVRGDNEAGFQNYRTESVMISGGAGGGSGGGTSPGGGAASGTSPAGGGPGVVVIEPDKELLGNDEKQLQKTDGETIGEETASGKGGDGAVEGTAFRIPKTGDDTNRFLWAFLLLASGAGLAGLLFAGRRRRRREEREGR